MIGVGTQDNLEEATQFVDDYGTESFMMLWDSTYVTWNSMGVTSSPTAILFDSTGGLLGGWVGSFPEDDVIRLATASA